MACIARKNFDKEKEIWLAFPKKASGKPCILYNNALEEAFCFEWIDSQVKVLDEEKPIRPRGRITKNFHPNTTESVLPISMQRENAKKNSRRDW